MRPSRASSRIRSSRSRRPRSIASTIGSCASIITLTEIPAPPFKEDRRAAAYLEMLRQHGLTSVERDAEGNVMGLRKGTGRRPDPGDCRTPRHRVSRGHGRQGQAQRHPPARRPASATTRARLAVLLALIRAMDAAGFQTRSDILFIGNVGEEGLGDLRGVKHLFQKGPYARSHRDVRLDGRRRLRRRPSSTAGSAANGIA